MRRLVIATLFVAGAAPVSRLGLHGNEREQPLSVSRVVLVESRTVTKHLVEEDYRADVTHGGSRESPDFAGVTAHLHASGFEHPGFLELVDGQLEFGAVRSGETVRSRDTITIRRLRYFPLQPKRFRWDVSARPDLVPGDAWAGTWRFTIQTKDSETGETISVDDITDTIGRREPVGFSLLMPFVRCEWVGTDHVLEAKCRSRVELQRCLANGTADFTIERNEATVEGHGQWDLTLTGDCGQATGAGASIVINAVRLSTQAPAGRFSGGTLTKLATSPALAALLAGQSSSEGQR